VHKQFIVACRVCYMPKKMIITVLVMSICLEIVVLEDQLCLQIIIYLKKVPHVAISLVWMYRKVDVSINP
jgi:hypothetical protein